MINDKDLNQKTVQAQEKSENGFYEEAVVILESLLKNDLTQFYEAGVLLNLAQISDKHGRPMQAIKYCTRLIDFFYQNLKIINEQKDSFMDFVGIILIIRATSHERINEYQKAVNDYNEIVDIYETKRFPISKMNALLAYHGLAMIQIRNSNNTKLNNNEKQYILDLAIENFETVLEIEPNHFPAYTQLGVIYSTLGNNIKSEEMYNKAISLSIAGYNKELPENGIIYQYRNIDDNLFKNLLNKKIFLNHPKYFNDPFDCPIYHASNYRDNIAVRNTLEKVRITCFSEDNNSILLWSHYADSHKGICIGYKPTKKYLQENSVHIEKVSYVTNKNNVVNEEEFKNFINETFYVKNYVWEYEKEYRLIGFDLEDNLITAPEIDSITFGIKTSKEDISAIVNIFKDRDIKLNIVSRKENDYINLEIKALNSM